MESPLSFFSGLHDPRVERTKAHFLEDIIFIAISSVICGADTWNDMELFGKSKEAWLRTILRLPEGIPSHDTFNRVFSLLDPKELETGFLQWTRSVAELTAGEVVSIDGKSIRAACFNKLRIPFVSWKPNRSARKWRATMDVWRPAFARQ